jgi:HSP20 family protein
MLGMTRWTPWTELAGLHRDLDAMFGRAFTEERAGLSTGAGFTPAADVRREDDRWLVSLAVPGVSPDDLTIEVVGRTLRVKGERRVDSQTVPVLNEIPAGSFERELTMPEDIDAKGVEASYRHGVIELVLPLTEKAKPHRVTIGSTADARQLHVA